MKRKAFFYILSFILILVLLSGCGKKSNPPSTVTPTLKSIQISPVSASVPPGGKQTFAAKGFDQNGREMTGISFAWSVKPAGAGTIKNGVFTAGVEKQVCTVVCEAKGIVQEVPVTITGEPLNLTSIEVKPDKITVLPKDTYQFTATGHDQNGGEMTGVSFAWSVLPAEAGTITQNGLFTASEQEQVCEVICEANGVEKKVPVTIKQETPIFSRIEVTPTNAVVVSTTTQDFSATGYDQYGNEMPDVVFAWSVDPDAGTIDENGLLTAGLTAGNYEVICEAEGIEIRIPIEVLAFADEHYLQAAGEQLVNDSQLAWDNFLAAPRLTSIFQEQLVPGTTLVFSVLNNVFDYVPGCFDDLYYCVPTSEQDPVPEYEELSDIYSRSTDDFPKTGTWSYIKETDEFNEETYDWDPTGFLKAIITRNVVGTDDQIMFNLQFEDLSGEETGTYTGEVRYPTANWYDYESGKTYEEFVDFSIDFILPDGTNGHVNGNEFAIETVYIGEYDDEYGEYEEIYVLHAAGGDANGQFTLNGEEYSFDGEISLQFNKDEPDFFTGWIDTPDARIEGDMEISYVSNPKLTHPLEGMSTLFPNKLVLEGSFADKKSPLAANGTFNLELANAAIFNFEAPYAEGNIPGIELSINGYFLNEENNQLAGILIFKEMAYKRFSIDVGYDVVVEGVTRQITLNANNNHDDDEKVTIDINSDWGSAAINMALTFKPAFLEYNEEDGFILGELDKLSGQVLVQGVDVGEIKMEMGVPWVFYNDGSKETF